MIKKTVLGSINVKGALGRLRRLIPKRLGAQFLLLFSLILALSMAVFSILILNTAVNNITSTKKTLASALANNISATGANFLLVRNYTALEELLLSIDFPEVTSIQVSDINGKLIADVIHKPGEPGEVIYGGASLNVPAVAAPAIHINKTSMEVWQPVILVEHIGWTKITYSLQDIEDTRQRLWFTYIFSGVVIILLALIALRSLMRRPLISIERYTEFASKLIESSGEKISVDQQSIEMERLGESLNNASARLLDQSELVKNAMTGLETLAAFPAGSPDIVLSINAESKITYINPHGQKTLAELNLGSDQIDLLLPQNYPKIIDSCLSDGTTARGYEIEFKKRTLLWTFAPLINQRIVHCYAHEITEKVKAEEHSRNARTEMQIAEAANQAKSSFLANMSHEIRTPLNGVMGFINLLSKTQLTGTQRDYLNTVEMSAKVLLTVINDILDFSKIEAGKVTIEEVEIDFRELLEETVSLHSANAEKKNIGLALVFNRDVPARLVGDPTRISQVLSNLLSNAIKFTKHGEVLIDVTPKEESDKDILVEISVKDSGIGIPESALANMFQPFNQADSSTTRKYGGTGLGLVIAKSLAEAMGGNITVESQVGQGTRFTLTLLMLKQANTDANKADMALTSKLDILIVSNSTSIARSLTENLASLGMKYTTINTAQAAIDLLKNASDNEPGYSAIIFDQAVNDMTSKEFSDGVKKQAHLSGVPIILLGSLSTRLREESIKAEGYAACICKPVHRSELYSELAKIFRLPNQNTSAAEQKPIRLQSKDSGRSLSVLIVDDNEINRKLARLLVENLGGETDLAENGAEAVLACTRENYDLILMDAHMPVMDGVEATIRIRAYEKNRNRHTPIIALTADALSSDRKRYMDAGMDEYLSKPINEKSFLYILEKMGLTVELPATSSTSTTAPANQANNLVAAEIIHIDAESALPILDPLMGIELSFGDRETWHTILDMLFERLPDYIASLTAATNNQENLRQAAHKLAGASSCCGTPAMTFAAKRVEGFARAGEMESAKKATDELLQEIKRLQALKLPEGFPENDNLIY